MPVFGNDFLGSAKCRFVQLVFVKIQQAEQSTCTTYKRKHVRRQCRSERKRKISLDVKQCHTFQTWNAVSISMISQL